MNNGAPNLSDAQFALLRTLIAERCGLQFPSGRKYMLESRLAGRLAELGLDDFDHYLALLTSECASDARSAELCELFSQITINETSFFRDPAQFEAFEQQLLPEMLRERGGARRLRIWSAACSTGQEPYTIAMIIERLLGAELSSWRIDILGTDLSPRVLDIARAGRYDEMAIRGIPAAHVDRALEREGTRWAVRPVLRDLVRFEQRNLMSPDAQDSPSSWDFIFCRNTMIYFDVPARERVLEGFCRGLAPGGTLLLGDCESTPPGSPFEAAGPPAAHAYRAVPLRRAA